MKMFLLYLSFVISLPAFASQTFYTCESQDAVDVGLPSKLSVEIEGRAVSVQDASNDIYYTGNIIGPAFNSQGDQIAVGYSGLILNGYVIVSSSMIKKSSPATLIVADDALDSVMTPYTCNLTF